jgi:hypothetical protein
LSTGPGPSSTRRANLAGGSCRSAGKLWPVVAGSATTGHRNPARQHPSRPSQFRSEHVCPSIKFDFAPTPVPQPPQSRAKPTMPRSSSLDSSWANSAASSLPARKPEPSQYSELVAETHVTSAATQLARSNSRTEPVPFPRAALSLHLAPPPPAPSGLGETPPPPPPTRTPRD